MLESKLAGEEIARPEPVPEAPVVDLMDALKRSVAEAQTRRKTPAAKREGARKPTKEKRSRTPA